MAEYIDREKLLRDINHYHLSDGKFQHWVEVQQAADVSPVRHGRWILERKPDGKPYCFHCSVCDDDFHYIGITVAYDYCPNCGAKMESDGE